MPLTANEQTSASPTIPVIAPRPDGESFVWYGDCCVMRPDHHNTANFARVNAVFQRLATLPDYVIMAGDNIMGGAVDADQHRRQWRYWLDEAMDWFYRLDIPIYQIGSNHNTFDITAEAVFRETFPEIPQNGPVGQEGLSYWVRRGDLLLIFVNTNYSGLGGNGHVECDWLDRVLTEQADAPHKLVVGHHPIFSVNGYAESPTWCVVPDQGQAFWDVLVRHGVLAYLCSHLLAYDVQVHQGVLQVLTGGAGTYGMHLGLMPEGPEYFHLLQGVLDTDGLRYQVLDTDGTAREWLHWPLPDVADADWRPFDPAAVSAPEGDGWIARFNLRGSLGPAGEEQTLLAGWQIWEGPLTLWLGLTGNPPRLTVQLVPEPGRGAQRWLGPVIDADDPFALEVVIHSGMGPGGVLARQPGGVWSSLAHTANRGAELLAWPEAWALGHGQSGPMDSPFLGDDLNITWTLQRSPYSDLLLPTPQPVPVSVEGV